MNYKLDELPDEIKKIIRTSHLVSNKGEHRNSVISSQLTINGDGLFDGFDIVPEEPEVKDSNVIWATDNYETKGDGYFLKDFVNDFSVIVPRIEKSKSEQKRRSKDKAEVFTPSWLCNEMNNLADDVVLYKGAFNVVSENKKWVPSVSPVKFSVDYSWVDYISERRMEMTAGEAPYLMSRYDTTTGAYIPIRDDDNRFARIGLIDRKLRIVTENANDDEWVKYALVSLLNSFGFEWQGDNLLLARLNFINTFIDYYKDKFGDNEISEDLLYKVAEISSWNLWQMDGLKMVVPLSCSDTCKSCQNKTATGHDGELPAVRFLSENNYVLHAFEDFLLED